LGNLTLPRVFAKIRHAVVFGTLDARARSLGSCLLVVSMGVCFTRSARIGQIEIRGDGIWRMRDGLAAEKGSTTKAMADRWNANAQAAHCIVGAWLVVVQA